MSPKKGQGQHIMEDKTQGTMEVKQKQGRQEEERNEKKLKKKPVTKDDSELLSFIFTCYKFMFRGGWSSQDPV